MIPNSKIIIENDPVHLAKVAVDIFTATAGNSINTRGQFVVALSGGSTPRKMYRMLSEKPHGLSPSWHQTYIFWVDERCVPESDPASNYGVAKRDLLNKVPVLEAQVYPMPGRLSPEEGAQKYQKMLMEFFHLNDNQSPNFDLIFLGMGTDGHTASLFPGQDTLDETERLIKATRGGEPHVSRLTMTLPVLNRARKIVFVISGRDKAASLKAVFEDKKNLLPAQRIRPLDGELIWLLDREAASLLSRDIIQENTC